MRADQERALLDRLAEICSAEKSFDGPVAWESYESKTTTRLRIEAPLRLDGKLGGGAFLRITTPGTAWESDVYGQIEVQKPAKGRWRLDPIEWRPLKPHTNGPDTPSEHRFKTLTDRIHPFSLNRRYGLKVLDQGTPGVAVEFPRAVSKFEEYLELCSEVWNFPELRKLPPPQWTMLLL